VLIDYCNIDLVVKIYQDIMKVMGLSNH